jgi:hypothetical protein
MKLNNINFVPVISSTVSEIAYHDMTIYVKFKNDSIYKYNHANIELYNEFLVCESKGKYFHSNIRPLQCEKLV